MMFTFENYGYGYYLVRAWESWRPPYEATSWVQLGKHVEFAL